MQGNVRNHKFYEYRNSILLCLLLEPPSLQVADLIRRLEFLYGKGNVRRPSVLEHLKRFFNNCIIDRKRFIIQPKWKKQGKKVFYKNSEFPTKTDKRRGARQNFSHGKYEVFCRIDPCLSPGYINYLKQEIASFFGYNYWYGGIIKEGNSPLKTYERVRKRYLKRRRARQKKKAFIIKRLDSEDWSGKVASNSRKKHAKHTVSRVMTKGMPGSCTVTL